MKEKRKSHGVQLLIRAVVRDPDGKILSDTREKPAGSFVIQLLEFIYILGLAPATSAERTSTDGGERRIYFGSIPCWYQFNIDTPANISGFGIVVGTGDTAVTNTDYKLDTQLTEGAGVGNITHGVMIIGDVAVVGANVDMVLKRTFTNNTGLLITVKEAGVVTAYTDDKFHLIIRDVLAPPIDVPDKCSLTIYYTLRTTV